MEADLARLVSELESPEDSRLLTLGTELQYFAEGRSLATGSSLVRRESRRRSFCWILVEMDVLLSPSSFFLTFGEVLGDVFGEDFGDLLFFLTGGEAIFSFFGFLGAVEGEEGEEEGRVADLALKLVGVL